MVAHAGMWWLTWECGGSFWGCGGSLVALQTSEAVVPGSNPASLTVENSEDRQSHCVQYTVKSRGREEDLPLGPIKDIKKIVNGKIQQKINKIMRFAYE